MRKILKKELVKYSLLFILCVGCFALPFLKLYRGLINDGDGFNQSYPVFVYIGQWLRAVLKGKVYLWDFRIGLGDDVIQALNWHGFGDITQLVSVFFPYKYAEYGYALTMLFKFWLCGFTFLLYIKRYVQDANIRVLGALTYSLSIYALVRGLNCWMYLTPMMTLPLIWKGIDRLLSESPQISKSLIIGVWIQALNGFYFLYIEVLLTIIYFLVSEVNCLNKNNHSRYIIKILKDTWNIVWQALIGAFLGAPLLIPSIIGFFNSNRNGSVKASWSIKEALFYSSDYYKNIIKEIIIPCGGNFTWGYIVVLGVFLAFIVKGNLQIRKYKILMIVFSVLGCIPLWGSITNGFSYISDRWIWGFLLIAVTLAMMGFDRRIIVGLNAKIVFYIFYGMMLLGYAIQNIMNIKGTIMVVGMYLVLGIAIFEFLLHVNKVCRYILPIGVTIIIINGMILWAPNQWGGVGYTWGFIGRNIASQNINASIDPLIEPEENLEHNFFRRDIYATSLGASLIKNYYGTAEYLSTLNGNTYQFFRNLAISPGIDGATWVLKGLDNRKELEALLSVKTEMDYTGENRNAIYYENPYFISFGMTFNDTVSEEVFDTLNPMEKESALMHYLVLDSTANEESHLTNKEICKNFRNANKEIPYYLESDNITYSKGNIITHESATIKVYLSEHEEFNNFRESDKELYVRLPKLQLINSDPTHVYIGNKVLQLRSSDDIYYMGVDEYWINVTEIRKNEKGYYFEMKFPAEQTFIMDSIHVYIHQVNCDSINERKDHILSDVNIGINEVNGKVDAKQKEWIFFTIPYSSGWKAYIDGQEEKVYRADVGFMAFSVEEGVHTIQLKYRTPGLALGIICFVMGMVLLLGVWGRQHIVYCSLLKMSRNIKIREKNDEV